MRANASLPSERRATARSRGAAPLAEKTLASQRRWWRAQGRLVKLKMVRSQPATSFYRLDLLRANDPPYGLRLIYLEPRRWCRWLLETPSGGCCRQEQLSVSRRPTAMRQEHDLGALFGLCPQPHSPCYLVHHKGTPKPAHQHLVPWFVRSPCRVDGQHGVPTTTSPGQCLDRLSLNDELLNGH